MDPIYLDHAATTPVRPEVREAMSPFLTDHFGNPSSLHRWGRKARSALNDARARVATALGARAQEIHFVRGGTESDNLAILGRAEAARAAGERPLVVHSAVEHHAVLEAAEWVEARYAVGSDRPLRAAVGVDGDGRLDLDALDRVLELGPAVASVMWVNNEIGTILPLLEVARRCEERGVASHTDAVQAVGKVPVRVDQVPVSLLTVTGHKIYGPKGTGVLYVREGTELAPMLHGGGQEGGLRPGTPDVAGAVGMAEALALAVEEREPEASRLESLRESLERGLVERVDGLVVHGRGAPRAPHVSSVGIPDVGAEALLAGLDMEGVAVSTGSACASGATRASHVLRALLGDEAEGMATLRFSMGRGTTDDHVQRAVAVTATVVERLAAAGV